MEQIGVRYDPPDSCAALPSDWLDCGWLDRLGSSKSRAVTSSRRNLILIQLKHEDKKRDDRIALYLADLDANDQSNGEQAIERTAIKAALAKLEAKQQDNRCAQS